MEKFISSCGLDCATCNARIATLSDDDDLREKTAAEWSAQFQASITADMINCLGCRQNDVLFGHCFECEIRNCVKSKNFDTCGECSEIDGCSLLAPIHQYVPEAKQNLLDLIH